MRACNELTQEKVDRILRTANVNKKFYTIVEATDEPLLRTAYSLFKKFHEDEMRLGAHLHLTASFEVFADIVKADRVCVRLAFAGELPVGLCIYRVCKRLNSGRYSCGVESLYVDPEYRHKGIATDFLDYAKSFGIVWLDCYKDNDARYFYEKLGFKRDMEWLEYF